MNIIFTEEQPMTLDIHQPQLYHIYLDLTSEAAKQHLIMINRLGYHAALEYFYEELVKGLSLSDILEYFAAEELMEGDLYLYTHVIGMYEYTLGVNKAFPRIIFAQKEIK
jgi:hypothetical protein